MTDPTPIPDDVLRAAVAAYETYPGRERWGHVRAVVDAVRPLLIAAGRAEAARDVETAMRAESDRLAAPGMGRAVEQGIGVAHAMTAVVQAARGTAGPPGSPLSPPGPQTQGEVSTEAQGGPRGRTEIPVPDEAYTAATKRAARFMFAALGAEPESREQRYRDWPNLREELRQQWCHAMDVAITGLDIKTREKAAYAAGRRDTAAEIIRTLETWSTGYWGKPRDVLKRTADDLARRYTPAETAGPVPEPMPSAPPSPWAPDWPMPPDHDIQEAERG